MRVYISYLFVIIFGLPVTVAAEAVSYPAVKVGVMRDYYNYQEFDEQGVYLDGEFGFLNGVFISVDKKISEIELSLKYERSIGSIGYVGQLGNGDFYATETDEEINNVVIEGKYKLKGVSDSMPILLFGLGDRVWNRDIKGSGSVSGLNEVYRWKYGMLGAAKQVRANDRWTIGFEGRWFRQINPEIEVDLGGGYDEVTLDLGIKNNFRLSSLITYKHSNALDLEMELYFQTWHIGRGNTGVITGTGSLVGSSVVEPESETYVTGARITAVF